jgi:hypothetical protein
MKQGHVPGNTRERKGARDGGAHSTEQSAGKVQSSLVVPETLRGSVTQPSPQSHPEKGCIGMSMRGCRSRRTKKERTVGRQPNRGEKRRASSTDPVDENP